MAYERISDKEARIIKERGPEVVLVNTDVLLLEKENLRRQLEDLSKRYLENVEICETRIREIDETLAEIEKLPPVPPEEEPPPEEVIDA